MTTTQAIPDHVILSHVSEIGSTNDEVRALGEAGALGPLWLRADTQTKGRGRRGRAWLSARGNLFMSGLLTLDKTPLEAANLSFVAALAVAEAIEAFVPAGIVSLKWPNDVLIDGRKTSGILLESWSAPAGLQLAIGIGINVETSPLGLDQETACVADHRRSDAGACHATSLFTHVVGAFHHYLEVWQKAGFAPIRTAWLARAKGIGDPIVVNLPGQTLHGVFMGLSETGALQLGQSDGSVRDINSGDVFFA